VSEWNIEHPLAHARGYERQKVEDLGHWTNATGETPVPRAMGVSPMSDEVQMIKTIIIIRQRWLAPSLPCAPR
jgi:hypothetical protein